MSTIGIVLGIALIVSAVILVAFGVDPREVESQVVRNVGLPSLATDSDKLGWMDDAEFTEADRQRVAEIGGGGFADQLGVIHNMQSGGRSSVTRKDYELMRQDIRRAQGAYPEVSRGDLTYGTSIQVDLSAHVPDKWGSGNSDGTKEGGVWYLDGSDYRSFVKPKYTKRADAATTKRVLAELKDAKNQKNIKRIAKWGYSASWGGSGGDGRIECYPDPVPSNEEENDLHVPGKCVVVLDGMKHVFPFVPIEWASLRSYDDIKTFASFKEAVTTPYVRQPEKPWVMRDGSLARGEKCADGRLCRSMWNGDGYDNTDIGPSNPASWVLDTPFGLGYLPSYDNGEQRSEPGKPWYLVISYYGSTPQASGGWTEDEAKEMLPKFQTAFSIGMQGQDNAALNQGNLQEARATQVPPKEGVIVLADRASPIPPPKQPEQSETASCVQGGTLMPGQSCVVR